MTIGSILLGIALITLVGLYLARPFFRRDEVEMSERLTPRQKLEIEKEAVLTKIRQTDFDFATGTIPAEVHEEQRAQLVAQAAEILQQIDELADEEETIDAAIETAVAQIRRQTAPPAAVKPPAAASGNGQAKFCPQCGSPVDPGDKFCTNCGHKLAAAALASQN